MSKDPSGKKSAKRKHTELSPEMAAHVDMASVKIMLHEVLQQYGLDTIKTDIADLQKSVNFAHTTGEEASKTAKKNEAEIDKLRNDLDSTKQLLTQEHEARLYSECQSRRSNLKFFGFQEENFESSTKCEELVLQLISTQMGVNVDSAFVERCHRLGPRTPGRNRPIIIKFALFKDRERVWDKRRALKDTNIFVKEDYPHEIEDRRNKLLPTYNEAMRIRASQPDGNKLRV